LFAGWVAKMKDRFRESAPPAAHAPSATREAAADAAPSPAGKSKG
jgi:hypothetical protein